MIKMIVKEVMNKNIYYIGPDESVRFALKELYSLGVHRLFVFDDNDCPIGVISYEDIILLEGSEDTMIDLDMVKVSDLMTEHITTINANAKIQDAANLILRAEVSGLLVVENNKNVGVLTKTDICRLVSFSDVIPK